MKVLFLHEVGYLEKPTYEMHELPEHLASRGHDVTFVDYVEDKTGQRTWKSSSELGCRVIKGQQIKLRHQNTWFKGLPGRLSAVVMFPFFFRRVLREIEPDIVVSYSVPTSGWQANLMCRAIGIPYLFRAIDVSHKIRRTRLSWLVLQAERFVYRKSDWVSANNEAMRSYCIRNGSSSQTTSVNLPPLDLEHFSSPTSSAHLLRRELDCTPETLVILYMGSFFYFSGLKEVVSSLAEVDTNVHLVLIGGGDEELELRSLVSELGLESQVTFMGYVPYEELAAYLRLGDVAINPMKPSLVSNAALPNKVIQYMAAGLPVVCTRLEGVQSLFTNEQGLKFVKGPEEVLGASIAFAKSNDLAKLGELNRLAVSTRFGLEGPVSDFEGLLLSLVRST